MLLKNRWIAIAAVSTMAIVAPMLAQTKPQPKPNVGEAAAPAPISLVELLKKLKTEHYPKLRLMKEVELRGLDFDDRPENSDAIQSATKDDDILSKVKQYIHPWRPPPPRPSPKGSVLVTCEPAECEITLNGTITTTSRNGSATFSDVHPGDVTLDFTEKRYVPQKVTAHVEADKQASVPVKLKLTKEAEHEDAQHWLDEMFKVLSAGEQAAGAQDLSASGSAAIWDSDGKKTDWGFFVKLSSGLSTLELHSANGKTAFVLECHGEEDCKQQASKTSNPFKGKAPIDLGTATVALRDFRKFHLGSVLKKLASPEIQLLSATLDPLGSHVLHLESNDQSYEVLLNRTFLIAQVSMKSKLGLGDSTLVVYSDYEPIDKTHAQYPKKTGYRTGEKRGMQAELTWEK